MLDGDRIVQINDTLSTNIVGSCFEITTSNLTLDCQNYLIDGDDVGTDYGVYTTGVGNISNISIHNCRISDFYDGVSMGDFSQVTLLINNSDFFSNTHDGIFGAFINTTIINTNSYNNGNDGVYLYLASNSFIYDSFFYNNSRRGIYSRWGTVLTANNLDIYDNGEEGFYLDQAIGSDLSDIDIYDNGESGLEFYFTTNSVTDSVYLYNNSFSALGGSPTGSLYVNSGSHNNTFSNMIFHSIPVGGGNRNAIALYSADDNTFENISILNSTQGGIYISSLSQDSIFGNISIENTDTALTIAGDGGNYMSESDFQNNTLDIQIISNNNVFYNNTLRNISKITSPNWVTYNTNYFDYLGVGNYYLINYSPQICFDGGPDSVCDDFPMVYVAPTISSPSSETSSSLFPFSSFLIPCIILFGYFVLF